MPKKPEFITDPPTKRQREIHEYMLAYQAEHGAPPSLREIAAHIGVSSANTTTDHMHLLERRGLVRHHPGRPRGWVPIRRAP